MPVFSNQFIPGILKIFNKNGSPQVGLFYLGKNKINVGENAQVGF
jgi:hypothetical protein